MHENTSTFESLSNEFFIDLFQYFNTLDLFQSFYNLNSRFNTLIQSFDHLHLTISSNSHSLPLNLLSSYIYSLTTIGAIELPLHQFPNLHRLILHSPSSKLLHQLQITSLPCLESLSIPDVLFGMSPIFVQIFSNHFPHLKSSHFLGFETIETISRWSQTTSLHTLKIGLIDFHVYKAILIACPNLHSLSLQMFQSYLKLSDIQTHLNLRKLTLHSEINDWRYNDQLIDIFLGCVMNLEELSISRSLSICKLMEFLPDYDWFASIIAIRLPCLKHLLVCLKLEYHTGFLEFLSTETRRDLRKFFRNAHQKSYQSRLIINSS